MRAITINTDDNRMEHVTSRRELLETLRYIILRLFMASETVKLAALLKLIE